MRVRKFKRGPWKNWHDNEAVIRVAKYIFTYLDTTSDIFTTPGTYVDFRAISMYMLSVRDIVSPCDADAAIDVEHSEDITNVDIKFAFNDFDLSIRGHTDNRMLGLLVCDHMDGDERVVLLVQGLYQYYMFDLTSNKCWTSVDLFNGFEDAINQYYPKRTVKAMFILTPAVKTERKRLKLTK